MANDIEFRFDAQKNIDTTAVMVVAYEGKDEMGTLIFTPDGWEKFQEQVLRTKVKCEG